MMPSRTATPQGHAVGRAETASIGSNTVTTCTVGLNAALYRLQAVSRTALLGVTGHLLYAAGKTIPAQCRFLCGDVLGWKRAYCDFGSNKFTRVHIAVIPANAVPLIGSGDDSPNSGKRLISREPCRTGRAPFFDYQISGFDHQMSGAIVAVFAALAAGF
jgi:hypothetical protein